MSNLVRFFLILVFAVFFSRAFFLTVLMHKYYERVASDNSVKTEIIRPARGVIVDRNGKLIATNIQGESSTIVRHYPDGELTASIVGYISNGVGVVGLEKYYQDWLNGENGERISEETASGKETKQVMLKEAVPGKELKLNIDLGIQKASYLALRNKMESVGKAGAVIVSKINGEALALVSLPSYDPNLFYPKGRRGSEGGIYSDAKSVVSDEDRKPLFNRAIGGSFPPGSVYKIVTALAGLDENVIKENTLYEDSGELKVGSYRFGNWLFDKYGKTEGKINVTKALARSNDIFFYKLGEDLGVDKLVEYSKKMGLGEKTGVDLPGESAGLLPNPLWMEKEKGVRWFLGNTYHMSIGQGDLLVTPLQVNRIFASAVSGKNCPPRLFGKTECEDLKIDRKSREVVMEGMRMACSEGGTGFPFFDLKKTVYCKTGTAQHGGEDSKPHSWISVVFSKDQDAGINDESIVVTVMLDEAGEGSEQAGPVARRIVDYILNKE